MRPPASGAASALRATLPWSTGLYRHQRSNAGNVFMTMRKPQAGANMVFASLSEGGAGVAFPRVMTERRSLHLATSVEDVIVYREKE